MKKLTEQNLNKPEHFDYNFSKYTYEFDTIRQVEFYQHIKDGMKVVDVGAGVRGFVEMYLASGGNADKVELHAIDFSNVALNEIKGKYPAINYIIGDVRHTPYADGYFDIVGAGELIEHIPDPCDLVKEMARICKPNGLIMISTVDPDCEDANGITYPEHLWQFTPEDLIKLFSPFGETEYKRVGNYDFIYCRKR